MLRSGASGEDEGSDPDAEAQVLYALEDCEVQVVPNTKGLDIIETRMQQSNTVEATRVDESDQTTGPAVLSPSPEAQGASTTGEDEQRRLASLRKKQSDRLAAFSGRSRVLIKLLYFLEIIVNGAHQ